MKHADSHVVLTIMRPFYALVQRRMIISINE